MAAAILAAITTFAQQFGMAATQQLVSSTIPRFLDLDVDPTDCSVRRDGLAKVVEFAGKDKAWQIFFVVFSCGVSGCERAKIFEAVYPGARSLNNLDQQKKIANAILEPLQIEIDADHGTWFLRHFGPSLARSSKPNPGRGTSATSRFRPKR